MFRIDIPDDHPEAPARRVAAPVVGGYGVAGNSGDQFPVADDRMADRMVAECKALTLAMGRRWLRADTHKKNKTMQNLLRRSGFQYRGNVLVDTDPGHDPRRLAFEVRLAGKPLTGEERP